jgi:hypothetical protein
MCIIYRSPSHRIGGLPQTYVIVSVPIHSNPLGLVKACGRLRAVFCGVAFQNIEIFYGNLRIIFAVPSWGKSWLALLFFIYLLQHIWWM